MRRLGGVGEARGAGRGADTFLIEEHQQCVGSDAAKSEIGRIGQPQRSVTVELGVSHAFENPPFELIPQRSDAGIVDCNLLVGEFGRFTERRDQRHALGATAQSALLVAAVEQRRERRL